MKRVHRVTVTMALAVVIVGVKPTRGQLPIPVQGQQIDGGRGQGRGQRGQPQAPQDPPPVVSAVAAVSAEITGPGKFYETLMELKPGDDLAHFQYVTKEYFVSGTANGQ